MENAIVRVPELGDAEVIKLINGPEAFTPDGEFILGPTEVRGFWVAAGLLRPRARGRRRDGPARRRVDRRGSAGLDVWEMDSRRFGRALRAPRATRSRARVEVYATYYDVKYPGHERQAGRPLRALADLPAPAGARRGLRREVGLGARELVRAERGRAATSRCGRAAGPAGSGRRRSGPSTVACRETAALFDETSFAKIEIAGERRAPSSSSGCARTGSPRDVGAITYTQMLNQRGGVECDFTVTRLAEERFRIVTGTAFGQHDLAWIREHAPDDVHGRGRDLDVRVPRPLGPDGARDPAAADDRRAARLPVHARAGARGRLRSVPRPARDVRRRARLGALLPDWSSGSRSGTRSGTPGREHGLVAGRLQGDRLAAAREGLPRLGRRHHARTTRRTRPGSASRSSWTRGTSSGARRCSASRSPSAGSAASCSTTRARSRSARSRSASTARSVGRVTSGGYGYTVERSIAYAYLPAAAPSRDERVEVEIFGEWVAGEVAAEPLFDPQGERIRG